MAKSKKLPKKLPRGAQMAALCFRHRNDKAQILLVTTRGKGRWILPKGWPMNGKAPHQSAAIEAFEEAGVKGDISKRCIGNFKYASVAQTARNTPRMAFIFPLSVSKLSKKFPEKGQRRIKWFSQKKAAALVRETKLKKIIRRFDAKECEI